MSKTALITGARGLLGSRVCEILAQNGHQVFAIIRPNSIVKPSKNITFLETDLATDFTLNNLDKVDTIFHLAQAGGHTDFIHSAGHIASVSISALCRLAQSACKAGVKRLVFASSGGVYGGGPTAFSEDFPLFATNGPALSFYLETKRAAENLLNHFAKHLDIIILRPFFIYGPGQREEMLFSRLKKSIVEKKEIFLAAGQGPLLNPIHVDDAAKATAACMDGEKPRIINISGDEVVPLRKICESFAYHIGIEPIFVEKTEPAVNFIGNNSLMRSHLHVPETTLINGLKSI